MTFRERLEANPLFWVLSALATGFLAGFSAYAAIQRIGQLEVISKIQLEQLRQCCKNQKTDVSSFGVIIDIPEEGASVTSPTTLKGTLTSPLPQGQMLWIILEDDERNYYPQGQLTPESDASWDVPLSFGDSWNGRNAWALIVMVDHTLSPEQMKNPPGKLMAKRSFHVAETKSGK